MGLFSKKKKTDRKKMVLMMDCDVQGELNHLMEEMIDRNKEYAMESVRHNFVMLLLGKKIKEYRPENVTGLFPNQWEAPFYRTDRPGMAEAAIGCARDHIRKNMPELDADQTEITVELFPGKPFAALTFDYD